MPLLFDERRIYPHEHAQLSANSRGRARGIEPCTYRTEYQRDVHRILYSQPFRRLKHKTQVFFLPANDHICTRIEHVIQVASASRTVARHLGLNEDLAEAIGLGHDLGHAPFGHHGETVLNEIATERDLGRSFKHEMHGLRVVDKLAAFDREQVPGLNLTYEVRDGILSHCGEDFGQECAPYVGEKILEDVTNRRDAGSPCTLEGCIVRMVDRICYAGRDLEDGIISGLVAEDDVPQEVREVLGANNGAIMGKLLEDLITTSNARGNVIALGDEKFSALGQLIRFNYERIYKCDVVELFKTQATYLLKQLFDRLATDMSTTDRFRREGSRLPNAPVYEELKRFIEFVGYSEDESNDLIVLDFMSGMTDNYVIRCLNDMYVPKSVV